MKTSCSSWSYHRVITDKKMTQMSWIDECARLELDGVELLGYHFPARDAAYLRDLKKRCADRYLTIAMVSAGGHLTTLDDAQRAADVQEIGQWMDVALYLGAPLVRFFCGSGPELAAGGPALYAKVLAAMKQVADMAEKKGVIAALENHGGTSADQLLAFQRDVGSPWFKFTLDTGNFPPTSRVGLETYTSIERCAPHAAIVHAKFFNVRPDGRDADFDWARIHGILRKAGFNGFLSVEYEGEDADEIATMRRIAAYLKKLR
jgi:sugar phosphate isomerase/epimerase